MDADTHEVVAALVTTNSVGDGEVLPTPLEKFAPLLICATTPLWGIVIGVIAFVVRACVLPK